MKPNDFLEDLYIPPADSHKGENGKLLIIGGSRLFHSAALWPLTVASRIVDMVFFSSVPENNSIAKREFRNGIVVPRNRVEGYIKEADCILIGPGLPRKEGEERGDDSTGKLTSSLLQKYPHKKWVVDGGSLQTIGPDVLPKNSIVTPHPKEFETLFKLKPTKGNVQKVAKEFNCIVILKGPTDYVCSKDQMIETKGGNAGMTKGGTGDVLAGLVAALRCKNEPFLSAVAGSFINKKAGESLFKKVGYYFNASDLANEIPVVMKNSLSV